MLLRAAGRTPTVQIVQSSAVALALTAFGHFKGDSDVANQDTTALAELFRNTPCCPRGVAGKGHDGDVLGLVEAPAISVAPPRCS